MNFQSVKHFRVFNENSEKMQSLNSSIYNINLAVITYGDSTIKINIKSMKRSERKEYYRLFSRTIILASMLKKNNQERTMVYLLSWGVILSL